MLALKTKIPMYYLIATVIYQKAWLKFSKNMNCQNTIKKLNLY